MQKVKSRRVYVLLGPIFLKQTYLYAAHKHPRKIHYLGSDMIIAVKMYKYKQWYHLVPFSIIRHHPAPFSVIWHHSAPFGNIQHHSLPFGIIWHHSALSNTIRHHLAPFGIIQHHRVPLGTIG